ncbi:prolipoprotein diacylglyceryl transferase [Kordiimonas sediminis]|uniref:Phosphatidylglycerol--prolipoprotein diacylglyceryl transferase n=1 Tax=Kordiimonas sediminis TaxID=1735581 RepID=A0A919ANQ0_9PROT|nr:prolipoprotein diacylglyceryl transferase [Kordiimonas sediminis]GHF18896.1 prolipoprotein diacylglyceryl transferase [Kordiimonas sediminis]
MLAAVSASVLAYPEIDPVLFELGPIVIRWYSLAYIAGLMFGWWYIRRLVSKPGAVMSTDHVDDFLTWAAIGTILGGRLGYVLFYNLSAYLEDPISILRLWDGGMSFHGGAAGVVIAVILFAKRKKLDLMRFADVIAIVAPVGLFTGRLANFINGELWGRTTDASWAMVFPTDPSGLPRHPSQLYEAIGEGLLLFLLLQFLYHKTNLAKERPGFIAGVFFLGYGLVRFLVEFVREPDAHIGLVEGISRGQMLSIPTLIFALWLVGQSFYQNKPNK